MGGCSSLLLQPLAIAPQRLAAAPEGSPGTCGAGAGAGATSGDGDGAGVEVGAGAGAASSTIAPAVANFSPER
jgi:hypothetical protein